MSDFTGDREDRADFRCEDRRRPQDIVDANTDRRDQVTSMRRQHVGCDVGRQRRRESTRGSLHSKGHSQEHYAPFTAQPQRCIKDQHVYILILVELHGNSTLNPHGAE
jgi:hypothetical protein